MSVSSFVQRIFWAFKFWVKSFFWVHQIDLTLHALILVHFCLSVWKSLVWFLLCWSLIPPICKDAFRSTHSLQSECWLKTPPDVLPGFHNWELHSALIKATAKWKPMTGHHYGCHLPHAGAGWGDKNTQTLNPHCWHFTLWQCGPIRLRYCNSGCACADCTHTFTSPLNPKTPGFWDSNTSYRQLYKILHW